MNGNSCEFLLVISKYLNENCKSTKMFKCNATLMFFGKGKPSKFQFDEHVNDLDVISTCAYICMMRCEIEWLGL